MCVSIQRWTIARIPLTYIEIYVLTFCFKAISDAGINLTVK